MFGIPVRLIFYAILLAIVVSAVALLKHRWNEHCGSICVEKMDKLTGERDKYLKDFNDYRAQQQRYNTEAATRFAQVQQEAAQAAEERDNARQQRFADVAALAAQIRARDARIAVSADTVRVLNRAIATANLSSQPAGPAAPPETGPAAPAADSSLAEIDGWVVTATRLYSQCVGQVVDLIAFYDGVRASISRGPTPLPERNGNLQPTPPPAS